MIDTTLFIADIPAGTYTKGDIIPLTVKRGPTVVRDGYGQPVLKDMITGAFSGTGTRNVPVMFQIQNSNWIDPVINNYAILNDGTILNDGSTGLQKGNECPLIVNSSWTVNAVVLQTVTTTADNSLFATIDIEYPQVGAVSDPEKESGVPCSITYDVPVTVPEYGSIAAAAFNVVNFDKFKAGSRYLMQKLSISVDTVGSFPGFVAFNSGASMGGLCRIVPVTSITSALCKKLRYASVEVKGPMNVEVLVASGATATATATVIVDYVKR